jgi:hypothetical protein
VCHPTHPTHTHTHLPAHPTTSHPLFYHRSSCLRPPRMRLRLLCDLNDGCVLSEWWCKTAHIPNVMPSRHPCGLPSSNPPSATSLCIGPTARQAVLTHRACCDRAELAEGAPGKLELWQADLLVEGSFDKCFEGASHAAHPPVLACVHHNTHIVFVSVSDFNSCVHRTPCPCP